jgi:hypothetical protein
VGDVHVVREAADAEDAFAPEQPENLLMALLGDKRSWCWTHAVLLRDVVTTILTTFHRLFRFVNIWGNLLIDVKQT